VSPFDSLIGALDAALERPALVVGTPPPAGRDLDLVVREPEERSAAAVLERQGFQRSGSAWARFVDRTALAVELLPAAELRLAPGDLEALFAEAEPLNGHVRLLRPAPHHVQQITSRLAHPPRLLARLEPAAVVALSGLDGAGKSTQSKALCEALSALGFRPVFSWLPLGSDRAVERLSAVIRRLTRRPAEESFVAAPGGSSGRGSLVTHAWATFVALANTSSHRRATLLHRGRGRVLVCDRYTLDAIVRLRWLYGDRRRFRFQSWLIRSLSPRPRCSFLLEVRAETAHARKLDRWTLPELTRQAELYREEADRLRVPRLDGERPPDELAAEIAAAVWAALRR
jgi:thymidylate kinase